MSVEGQASRNMPEWESKGVLCFSPVDAMVPAVKAVPLGGGLGEGPLTEITPCRRASIRLDLGVKRDLGGETSGSRGRAYLELYDRSGVHKRLTSEGSRGGRPRRTFHRGRQRA